MPYKFCTPQRLRIRPAYIVAKGFGKPHKIFGIFVIIACMSCDCFKLWGADFFSDLDVGACIF